MSSLASNSSASPGASHADRATTTPAALSHGTPAGSTSGGKVKQTRKRQRLSCVECTKRRQKCDRQFPCGLCTSRGIPHLCHWEPIVARPEPQRPPTAGIAGTQMTIATLTARIASLEQELVQAKNAIEKNERGLKALESSSSPIPVNTTSIPHSDGSSSGSGTPAADHLHDENGEKDEPRALLDSDVQAAAVALAQLSLAPKTEFVGNGSVLSAIHALGDFESWRFPYSSSSLINLVTTVGQRNARKERVYQAMVPQLPCTCDPDLFPGRRLAALMPPRPVVEELISAWFAERNWQYGLSEGWFMSGLQEMWKILERPCDPSCLLKGGCDACTVDINPHWMCLLFSMLAIAPTPKKSSQDRVRYFQSALEGRRYMDDVLASPADYAESEYSVHGAALTIIATSFLAMYLAESGRLSEAWKLAGCGLRHAQALGMHRDPGWQRWQNMHQLERELRLAGWWWIVICDRFWSFALGRPPMVLKNTYDVIPEFMLTHADGTPNHNAVFVNALLNLSEIVGDIAAECFGPYTPPYDKVMKLEDRLLQWEQKVPDVMHWSRGTPVLDMVQPSEIADHSSPAALRTRWLLYQRYTLSAWYMGARMNIHRPFVSHAPPIIPLPGTASPSWHLNPSREKCISTAMVLTRLMCEFQDQLKQLPKPCRLVDASTFTYFTFDGAVACAGALRQNPPHPKKDEAIALIDKAILALKDIAGAGLALEGACEAAKRGVVVLKTLKKAAGCDEHGGERGELVLLEDMLRKHRSPDAHTSSPRSVQIDPPPYTPLWNNTSGMSFPSSEMIHESMYTMPHELHQATFHSTQPSLDPYLRPSFSGAGSHNPPPPVDPSPFTVTHPALPPMTADTEMSWGSSLNAWGSAGIASRPPTQTLVTPFEVLQGVDMGASDISEIDLNWARLAGMDSWFSLHGQNNHGI